MSTPIPRFLLPSFRSFSTASVRHQSWRPGPSPPPLPKHEQETFERLQRSSTGAFSTPTTERASMAASTKSTGSASPATNSSASKQNAEQQKEEATFNNRIEASGQGEELHPDIRRGAKPEFEGDRNPKTGETGGPKSEPLRWGDGGDWSYNGRVTDF